MVKTKKRLRNDDAGVSVQEPAPAAKRMVAKQPVSVSKELP